MMKKIVLFPLFVLLIAATFFLLFYLSKTKVEKEQVKGESIDVSWQKYQNDKFGFSFEYPPTLRLSQINGDAGVGLKPEEGDEFVIIISIIPFSFEEAVWHPMILNNLAYKIEDENFEYINNFIVKRLKIINIEKNKRSQSLIFAKEQNLSIELYLTSGDEKNKKIFELIASSLRFMPMSEKIEKTVYEGKSMSNEKQYFTVLYDSLKWQLEQTRLTNLYTPSCSFELEAVAFSIPFNWKREDETLTIGEYEFDISFYKKSEHQTPLYQTYTYKKNDYNFLFSYQVDPNVSLTEEQYKFCQQQINQVLASFQVFKIAPTSIQTPILEKEITGQTEDVYRLEQGLEEKLTP